MPRRLEVLFLGDDRGHNPIERYRVLKQELGTRGFNLTFIEELDQVSRERLDLHDALIVYANHERDPMPGVIREWVRDGGGLVALHSAAGCFHPSEEWFDMIGGRFLSHEGHVFSPRNVDPSHPITRDLPKLESWDETYVHQDLTDDRHLLQERPPIHEDEKEPEPWTWTRKEGEGRVFYTASGHDLRTWSKPAYQELVARAIVWSVGDELGERFASIEWPELSLHTPEVENRAHPEIPMMALQKPLPPQQSALHTQVPAGTRLELFAAEPMVVNPIAIDWDHRGRCWVVESLGYPNDVPDEPGTGQDRIKILEDIDGDGRADRATVFADGLRHATTITFANGGVLATDGRDIVWLSDTNGDDVADVRRVLASGIRIFDTHASVSQFLYGMDNWIHATVGYSGVDMEVAGERFEFRKGVFRFRPDMTAMEFIQGTTNNTWGLGFTEEGDIFGSTANNHPSWMVSIPASAYRGSGIEQPVAWRLDDQPFLYPNTRDLTQVDQIEKYTAAADHKFYTDGLFPGIFGTETAFICEPTGHLVAMGKVSDRGAMKSIDLRGNNLFASADAWASPVAVRAGPDGAVWIADWYNPIIQHNVVFRFWNPAREYDEPHSPYHTGDHKPGQGNAYETPLRDRSHGRIWRIVPAESPVREVPVLDPGDTSSLVDALGSPSMHVRLHAQRLLVEHGQAAAVVPDLAGIVREAENAGIDERPVAAWHALRVLAGLPGDESRGVLVEALDSSRPDLRRQALQAIGSTDPALSHRLPKLVELAGSERERLLVFNAIALSAPSDRIAEALWSRLLEYPVEGPDDPVIRHAVALALRKQGATLLAPALAALAPPESWLNRELETVARRVAAGANRAALVAALEGASAEHRARFDGILSESPVEPEPQLELPPELVRGRDAYLKTCVECHQANGTGVVDTFPPLVGSKRMKDADTLLKIMLGGLMGPIEVDGRPYNNVMPGHSHADDEELAAIANYVRHAFGRGEELGAIAPADVKALRPEVGARKFRPYTAGELPAE